MNNIDKFYLAYVLSEETRLELLRKFPPKYTTVICHHITIVYNLTEDLYATYCSKYANLHLKVIGYVADEFMECLVVIVGDTIKREDGSTFHITLSLEPPRVAFDSNLLLQSIELQELMDIYICANLELVAKG